MKNKTIIVLLITVYILGCCTLPGSQNHQRRLFNGIDAELYKDTPAWQLVHALEIGNFELAKEEISKDTSLANFVEPDYGNSVLFWATLNSNEEAVELLLDKGARVNLCNFSGDSPLEMAAFFNPCKSNILQMMLKHQPLNDSLTYYLRNEALVSASSNCLNFVKILVSNQANPSWKSKKNKIFNTLTPLSESVIQKKFDIVEYYLIDLGVNPSTGSITTVDGDTVSITELLQNSYKVERTFDQEKTRRQIKKILDFLERKRK